MPVFCQGIVVKGLVKDTSENKSLQHATIFILNKSDSVLVKFTRARSDGGFEIKDIKPGEYILTISYPKYAGFSEEFTVKATDSEIDFKLIPVMPLSKLLQEVIVRSVGAIRIKGDTTEFIADSFKVKEGANVEDLMRKLPGFTVNSRGEITVQGKRVDKVLVDGEEFFGDDPTIATQNIQAKAVDKVQVYDTKTEQQQLTGITTGNEGKTVNIQLKEDAKKGYFGKAEAGWDGDELFNSKLLFNRFTGKKKFSVFGTKSNTSTGNLNWQEQRQLGGEQDYEYDEIGGFFYSFSSDDDFSDWSLRGLPNAYSAGAIYIDKWNRDKQSINSSYKYNRLGTRNETSTLSQTLLADTTFYNTKTTKTSGLNQQHLVNGRYEWKPDSMTSFRLSSSGTYRTNESVNNTYSNAQDEDRRFVNTSDRVNRNNSTNRKLENTLVYKQLFKKKGRQLIATLRYGIEDNESAENLLSENQFYKNGLPDSTENIDQMKLNEGESETYGGKFSFNEPIGAKWNLVAEYSYYKNYSASYKNTFEKDNNGKYTIINPVFSNNFDLEALSHAGTAYLRYSHKKLNLAAGSGISAIKLNLLNIDNQQRNSYHFLNVTPQFNARYNLKAQSTIHFGYQGRTRQPTINQLQPVQDNNDPLNIYTGNPDLDVGFGHNFNFGYNSFKILSQRYLFVGGNLSIDRNAITTISTIDAFGKRTYMPVNVDGNYFWNIFGSIHKQGSEKKLNQNVNINAGGGRNINFINGQRNENTYTSFNVQFGIGKYKEDKYNFDISPIIGRNFSRSSLRSDVNNNYWSYGGNIRGSLHLPWRLEIATDINLDLREKIDAFDQNTNITVWNASLTRSFFKKKNGKLIFSANDILNQNKGFTRTINSNFVTDERFLRLSRYFMLSFQWSFTQSPGEGK